MDQSNFHSSFNNQASSSLPIIGKLTEAYKRWQDFLPNFPNPSRYTLGSKIDTFFIEVIESVVISTHLAKEEKLPYLNQATTKLDLLKFFLQIAWQIRAIDNKKYLILSGDLDEIGRMLGGWIRDLKKKLPA